jgi:diadenosine tetraphosphatase ApaH/serine/threonine PP2A family protein phosphatase
VKRLAVLYDVHGNLAALEAVLAEVEAVGVDGYLLGGDYATFGAWPRETVERLEELPVEARLRGNVERWLVEPPEVPAQLQPLVRAATAAARAELTDEQVARLYALPEQAEVDGVLYCHASPRSDIESFAPRPEEGEERMLAGVRGRTVVFGHSHVQFARSGPDETELVNPGSVGQPLDGDTRAAWAIAEGERLTFRRTEYDVERAAAQMRRQGDWAETIAQRLENARG